MTTSITSAAPQSPAATSPTASGVHWRRLSWWFGPICWLLAGCLTPQPSPELVCRSEPLLGTFVTIAVYAENRERINAAVCAAFEEFRRIVSLMSIHRVDSELGHVNTRASVEPVVPSGALMPGTANRASSARQ